MHRAFLRQSQWLALPADCAMICPSLALRLLAPEPFVSLRRIVGRTELLGGIDIATGKEPFGFTSPQSLRGTGCQPFHGHSVLFSGCRKCAAKLLYMKK